tara:strand:- start:319 stop:450 length:132 start_codon:yes stop_codon:yes gene_type:complete
MMEDKIYVCTLMQMIISINTVEGIFYFFEREGTWEIGRVLSAM